MHKAIPVAIAVVAALGVSGCTKGRGCRRYDEFRTPSRRKAQWEKDYAAKDLNALTGHYADDAAPAVGRPARDNRCRSAQRTRRSSPIPISS